eukprot:4740890-Pyramimonas_sp.AAC.2
MIVRTKSPVGITVPDSVWKGPGGSAKSRLELHSLTELNNRLPKDFRFDTSTNSTPLTLKVRTRSPSLGL